MSHRPRTIRLLTAAAAWDNAANFQDSLNSTMRVGSSGRYVWDVNPSTRPAKSKRLVEILADEPVSTRDYNNRPAPPFNQYAYEEFEVTQSGLDVLRVDLSWPTSAADDLDLVVYWVDPNGRRVEVGSSGNAPGQTESAKVVDQQSVYVERGQQVKLDLKECSRKWKSTL